MSTYTKEQAIKVVTECAVKYHTHLMNRTLLFITMDKHKKTSSVEVMFAKRHFLHLTGCKVDKDMISSERFFDMCIEKKLSTDDFEMAKDGTSDLKLDILPFLMTKNLSANSVGDYNGIGVELYTEKIAGSVKGCIGFQVDRLTQCLVPNTVLNKDIRLCTKVPQDRIIATYRKSCEENKYSEIVYAAKKVEWDKVSFPAEYTYLFDMISKSNSNK